MDFIPDTGSWAKHVYGACRLGDKRRTKRLVAFATRQALRPDASIPTACEGDSASQEGAYRFIENDLVDAHAIEEGTSKRFLKDADGLPVVLALQDTTTVTYSHALKEALGATGAKTTRGMLVHSVLLVEPEEKSIIGLGAQKWWVRKVNRKKKNERRQVPYRDKESYKWEQTLSIVLQRTKRKAHLVSVCDREADIHEFLQFHAEQNLRHVIRSWHSRALETPRGNLWTVLSKQPVVGHRNVVVEQRGPGQSKSTGKARAPRKGRIARTEIRTVSVTIKPGKYGVTKDKKSLSINAIKVSEVDCPPEEEPLKWILLTTEPVDTLEAATRVINYYEMRWLIEEFHKCWKTGCALEQKRLQELGNLERIMAILAPIAARLLQLKSVYDSRPEASCEQLMSRTEWVCLWLHSNPRKKKPPKKAPTINWALTAVARTAGWTDTKRTGRIGWRTLWKGWFKFEEMVKGFETALRMQGVKL